MVRKLAGTLATVGMLSSPLAFALGLGEAELLSSLNQPFKATIQLAQTKGVDAEDIRVQLADERAFAKAGLDRQFFLQNLSFSVLPGENGPYIELTSAQPVKEPFLNFLLEVEWPQGQLMREYTFLLDPPTYNNTLTQQYAQTSQTSQPLAAPAAGNLVEEGARRIKVGPTDTLWSLARKNRPDTNVTIKQAMLAIQDANPDAFPTGNINNMEAGSTILIPNRSAMISRSELEAIREVASQNKAWVAFKAQSVPAEPKAEPVMADAPVESQPLKLVAEAEETAAPEAASADVSEELALSKETLDQSAREKAELSSRLDDLQKQVNTLQKLIRLKDEQLAAMEAMLDKQNQLLAGKSVADASEGGMNQEVQPPVASTSSAATTGQVTAGAIGLDLAAEAEKQNAEAEMPAKQEMASEAVKEEAKPEPVKSFSLDKQETQELDPGSFLVDSLRKNATIIGGAAAAVLALVLLLMVMRRRRKSGDADAKKNSSDDSGMSDLATGAVAGAAGVAALDAISDDDLPDDLALDDDLSGDLDDDLSGGLDDTSLDMDLSLDETPAEPAAEELSLDDLGESDALAESSSAEIEDLGDFDLGDLDADDEPAAGDGEALDLDGELDLDDLDFSEDFDLGDLDDGSDDKGSDGEEDSQVPFAQAELTENTVSAEEADSGESAQDNLIELDTDELEIPQAETLAEAEDLGDLELEDIAEPEAVVDEYDDSEELIDLEGDDLSDLDLLDDTEGLTEDSLIASEDDLSDDDLLAELANEAAALEAAAADESDELVFDDSDSDDLSAEDLSVDFDLDDLSPEVDLSVADDSAELSLDDELSLEELSDEAGDSASDVAGDLSALDEAQTYRELGQPEQAAAILQRTLGENPEDNDVRLKFMEVLVDLGDEATFDHELRQLQEVGDAKALSDALALQQELYNKVGASNYVASPSVDDLGDLDDIQALDSEVNTSAETSDEDSKYDLDLSSELDALERDFTRYAGEESSDDSSLDDVDFELTDLDLSDDIKDNEPMINLDPLDLGEPEPLDTADFELTDLADLESDDLVQISAAEEDSEYDFDDTREALRSDTQDYIADLGDLSMSASKDSDALQLSGMEDLVGQDLSDDDEIVDLSPNIDEEDDLADLGELSDIAFDESSDDDQLNIDGLLDENEDPEIKLDLARAYVDMGNTSSAIEALEDVLKRGNADQKEEASALIAKLQGE
ncbi:FimV/HubP family polar landmark protein [Oceanospirillum sanctuarii]|uniref:FimV/HubP family polar landmark protein n=1 Tax=Oceanospirillum sanctuarii TaxID=1434821 RepID=UPI000A3B092B|nr:FimV/HubP family polar landmark protein [Oceanospirillum sanctuarii]